MTLENYTKEMIDENSFIDMSHMYLKEKGKEANFYDIIDRFKEIGGYSDKQIEARPAILYGFEYGWKILKYRRRCVRVLRRLVFHRRHFR